MSMRRGPLEIRFDIIKALQDEDRFTWICYKTNLAPKRCKEILNELVGKGLVAIEMGRDKRNYQRFILTSQGIMLLSLWLKMHNILI